MLIERDAELSALLDGALAPAEEVALRAELARDPALAARLAELAQVDAALRALPSRPVPADLRARLQAKLAAEARARASLRELAPPRASRRRTWLAGASAAVAAAAAAIAVLVVGAPTEQLPAATSELAENPPVPPPAEATSGAIGLPVASEELAGAPAPAPLPDEGIPADSTRIAAASAPAPAPLESAVASPLVPDANASQPLPSAPEAAELAAAPAPTEPAPEALGSSPATPPQLAVAPTPPPALFVEVTDEEAAALRELEANDAGVVAVLDFLGELDALEAEAS